MFLVLLQCVSLACPDHDRFGDLECCDQILGVPWVVGDEKVLVGFAANKVFVEWVIVLLEEGQVGGVEEEEFPSV